MANALLSRSLPWSRTVVRVTTARLAARLAETHGFPLSDKRNSDLGLQQSGEFRANGAPPFVRVIGSWRPPRAVNGFRHSESRARSRMMDT